MSIIMPDLDQKTVFIACLDSNSGGYRWLHGSPNTTPPRVETFSRLPSLNVKQTGDLWQAIKVESNNDSIYKFKNLAIDDNKEPHNVFLEVSANGNVTLDDESKGGEDQWIIKPGPIAEYYPIQPWGNNPKQNYTFTLQSVSQSNEKESYLTGSAQPDDNTNQGKVTLSNNNSTKSKWLILIAAWTAK